jgi:hypothetical protein
MLRGILFVLLVGIVGSVLAGCGASHRASDQTTSATTPPRWVQRANALCKRDDRAFHEASFESAAMFMGLRREVTGLGRLGFFRHVPAVEADLQAANRLLIGAGPGDFPQLRKADKALIRARRDAARSGVHCSFGAYPLVNL